MRGLTAVSKLPTILTLFLLNFLLVFAPAAKEIAPLNLPTVKLATGEGIFRLSAIQHFMEVGHKH